MLDGMEQHHRLVVIAATNRPDVLNSALLRSGRFDRMLRLELPTTGERLEILKIHTRNKPLDASLSLERLAEQSDGFSGADLEALTNAAGLLAVRRTRKGDDESCEPLSITSDDFDGAAGRSCSERIGNSITWIRFWWNRCLSSRNRWGTRWPV